MKVTNRHTVSRKHFLATLAPFGALVAAGCASSGTGTGVRRDPDRISTEELNNFSDQTLHDAIRRLRANWIRRGGTGGIGQTDVLQVYVNGAKFGPVGVLREIPARDVLEVQYLNGPDATTRFGTGNGGGAVLVTMR